VNRRWWREEALTSFLAWAILATFAACVVGCCLLFSYASAVETEAERHMPLMRLAAVLGGLILLFVSLWWTALMLGEDGGFVSRVRAQRRVGVGDVIAGSILLVFTIGAFLTSGLFAWLVIAALLDL
jgi:hypothetical protein